MKTRTNIFQATRRSGTARKIGKAMMVITCAILFSFSARPGGEGFEVYLNSKLVIQAHGAGMDEVKSLDLKNSSATDKLTVKYFHCGKIGKNRIVTLKNAANKVIRTFRYPDTQNNSSMEIPLRDLNVSVRLFYSSTELPKERPLLVLNTSGTMAKK